MNIPQNFVFTGYELAHPSVWLGKRKMTLIYTVPWPFQPTGRQARKAKFAARAKCKRAWLAAYKAAGLAAGAFLPPA